LSQRPIWESVTCSLDFESVTNLQIVIKKKNELCGTTVYYRALTMDKWQFIIARGSVMFLNKIISMDFGGKVFSMNASSVMLYTKEVCLFEPVRSINFNTLDYGMRYLPKHKRIPKWPYKRTKHAMVVSRLGAVGYMDICQTLKNVRTDDDYLDAIFSLLKNEVVLNERMDYRATLLVEQGAVIKSHVKGYCTCRRASRTCKCDECSVRRPGEHVHDCPCHLYEGTVSKHVTNYIRELGDEVASINNVMSCLAKVFRTGISVITNVSKAADYHSLDMNINTDSPWSSLSSLLRANVPEIGEWRSNVGFYDWREDESESYSDDDSVISDGDYGHLNDDMGYTQ